MREVKAVEEEEEEDPTATTHLACPDPLCRCPCLWVRGPLTGGLRTWVEEEEEGT